ncbi:MAG: hypothetical protein ABIT01_06735 [Thermoanaerobaculia bacterium]
MNLDLDEQSVVCNIEVALDPRTTRAPSEPVPQDARQFAMIVPSGLPDAPATVQTYDPEANVLTVLMQDAPNSRAMRLSNQVTVIASATQLARIVVSQVQIPQ